MLADLKIPEELLQRAFDKLDRKLEAKETKFFTFRGEVVEKVDVEDHATQLSAVDKILSMAGVYARERDAAPAAPTVAVEVDPVTGVIRLVVGPRVALDRATIAEGDGDRLQTAMEDSSDTENQTEEKEEESVQIVKVRKGGLPIDIHDALWGQGA